MAEITEAKYRGTLTASGTTCVIIGILTQFVLGTFLPWRSIAVVCLAMPIITITALQFVPESPYWLIAKNRTDEAIGALAWLRGWTKAHRVDDEFVEIHRSIIQQKRNVKRNTLSIAPYMKRTFLIPFAIIHATLFIGCFCGKTTLQTYAVGVSLMKSWCCKLFRTQFYVYFDRKCPRANCEREDFGASSTTCLPPSGIISVLILILYSIIHRSFKSSTHRWINTIPLCC